MKKPKCLRLDPLVLSKEGLPVCPRAAARHGSEHWEGLFSIPQPTHPAQGADAHTSRAKEGWLTRPQTSEPHLDFFPKIHYLHLHTQSCHVKVHTTLTGYRFDCYLIY